MFRSIVRLFIKERYHFVDEIAARRALRENCTFVLIHKVRNPNGDVVGSDYFVCNSYDITGHWKDVLKNGDGEIRMLPEERNISVIAGYLSMIPSYSRDQHVSWSQKREDGVFSDEYTSPSHRQSSPMSVNVNRHPLFNRHLEGVSDDTEEDVFSNRF